LDYVNQMVHYSTRARNTDRALAAIADPTRRAIVDRLARGPARISDVAADFPMTLTGFCKHVRILERAGLVRRKRRGRENTLRLQPEPLRDVAEWVLQYREFWTARLDRLEEFFADRRASTNVKGE
jgi:DNA-binding transcriptional ArsR family regulator